MPIIPWFQRQRFLIQAVLMGAVLILPALAFQLNPHYRGIFLFTRGDEAHYMTMINRVSAGHFLNRNSYIYEGRNSTDPTQFEWSEFMLGLVFRIWPFGMDWYVLMMRFLSYVAAAYLLQRLMKVWKPELPEGWRFGAVVSWFVLPFFIGPDILLRISQSVQHKDVWTAFLSADRFVNPLATTSVLFVGFLIHRSWNEHPSLKRSFWLGVWIAFCNAIYIYFWMFLCAYIGLWMILYLLNKDWVRVRRGLFVFGIAGIASAPFWFYTLHHLPNFSGFARDRALAIITHKPVIEKSALFCIAVYLLWTFILWRRRRGAFGDPSVVILGFTAVVAVNQHVITGRLVQARHFYLMTDMPVASLLIFLVFAEACAILASFPQLQRRPRINQRLGVMVALFVLFLGWSVQASTVRTHQDLFLDHQRWSDSFNYIREHHVEVVYAQDDIAELIPVYTQAYVSYAPHAIDYNSTPPERLEWGWFMQSYLNGLRDPAQVGKTFQDQRAQIGYHLYDVEKHLEQCGSVACFPDADLQTLIKDYQAFLREDIQKNWFRYRLDLVIWDEKNHPEWHLERFRFLQKVQSFDGLSLWKPNPT